MDEPEMKIIDVFICKLRKKLASAASGKDYIETVRGRGYVLRELNRGGPGTDFWPIDFGGEMGDQCAESTSPCYRGR
jgi:hypothetical protein